TSASAAIGSIAAKALTASLTGGVAKIYDGTTAATLAGGNYTLAGAVTGDAVALNNPISGSYDTKNVGTAKTVSVGNLALTGSDAANYTVNADASAAIGSIAAKALTASLTGIVTRTANGGTAATLSADNFVLAGFVPGEGASVTQTAGVYASPGAGTAIMVSTTLAEGDFAANGGTALANYVLPLGALSGTVGTINPQIIVTIAAQPVLSVTSVPVPTTPAPAEAAPAPAPAPAAAPAAAVATVAALPIAAGLDRSPPSPVAAQKPPTPVDTADAGDPILASVEQPSGEKPASHGTPQKTVTTPIAGGLLAEQRTLPSRGSTVPGVDEAFSGGGASF
ncbi:YDG domain-containing protein, partial [Sphingomonas sp. CROZ-RG-20F-R02-07]|uniref:YDG domain-containing protein n=1 Tax=Sphingomonas sp. CROZ-RG-20F-R02-07 TaxID=2914832 RepID=UPI001F56E12C